MTDRDDTIHIPDAPELAAAEQKLRDDIARLTSTLEQITKQRDELETSLRTAQVQRWRDEYGVQIVCPRCYGGGELAPVDLLEGPDPCARCGGLGYLWAVLWRGGKGVASEIVEAICDFDEGY